MDYAAYLDPDPGLLRSLIIIDNNVTWHCVSVEFFASLKISDCELTGNVNVMYRLTHHFHRVSVVLENCPKYYFFVNQNELRPALADRCSARLRIVFVE